LEVGVRAHGLEVLLHAPSFVVGVLLLGRRALKVIVLVLLDCEGRRADTVGTYTGLGGIIVARGDTLGFSLIHWETTTFQY
jgi:hypothetical protein